MTTIDTHRSSEQLHDELEAQHEAGWFADPLGQHQLRYHDGMAWTTHVTHFGPSPCTGCH